MPRAWPLTVAVTLALGIGANAAVFSVVRQVLFRPLVNRDEDRLVYIRQSAPGIGAANLTFSMPEIADLESRVTTLIAFGDFSTIDLTMVGFGEPRVVKAGVVSRLVLRRDGPSPRARPPARTRPTMAPTRRGSLVLTHRFWSTVARPRPGGDRQDRPPGLA